MSGSRLSRAASDPADMAGRVAALPEQMRSAWRLANDGPALLGAACPRHVYVCGMGGSAIGGDFLRAFAAARGRVPVEVVRGYALPRPAGEESFALFVSYSGETEETLSAWDDASRRGVPRAAITSGGALEARANQDGAAVLKIPAGSPPRAALGWTTVPQLAALAGAGLIPFGPEELEDAASACEEVIARHGQDAAPDDPLRAWSEACAGRLPVVYAPAEPFAPSALRWATQLNENAKTIAHLALFPEQNHNEIVGWEEGTPADCVVAFLGGSVAHPRTRRRMEIVAEGAEEAGARVACFEPAGRGLAGHLFSLAVMGDLASLHLAAARNVDPTPVASIDRLKRRLDGA